MYNVNSYLVKFWSFVYIFLLKQNRRKNIPQQRKEREPQTYQLSRWVPYVKDLMEEILDEKLDQRAFPFLMNRPNMQSGAGFTGSR